MRNCIAPVLVATLIFACSSNSTNQDDNTGGGNASMTFALSGGDFTGNSVRICGSRTAPDPKYRCNSSLTPDIEAGTDAGDACPCFNFNPDGSLVDETGAPAVIMGLCPSADYPPANWDFSYALFASPNCQGTQLNDGEHNFTCYDSKDIATQQYANQSIDEVLVSGLNTNHILCNTVNASKQWNFASCATATTPADMVAGNVRYDCGCTPAAGTCNCGPGGVTSADLEASCSFETTTCNILCTAVCEPLDPLAPAAGFNVFVEGNAELDKSQAAGAVAIGGDLIMNGGYNVTFQPGTTVTVNGISNIGLVVNGAIDWVASTGHVNVQNNADAYIGDFNGGTFYSIMPPILVAPHAVIDPAALVLFLAAISGTISESVPFDVASQFPKLLLYSAKMGALSPATCADAATATILNDGGQPWMPGDGNGHLVLVPNKANILNLTVDDVIALPDLIGDVPSPSEPLIINITDSGIVSLPGKDFLALMGGVASVIWNFPHATSVTLVSGHLWGTTYAPAADVIAGSGATFEDDVVANTFVSPPGAGEVHFRPGAFSIPCLCDP